MIDIIGHFFILYPIFTMIKDSGKKWLGNSQIVSFTVCMSIWAVALVLTNQYLMDVSIISSENDVSKQNFY